MRKHWDKWGWIVPTIIIAIGFLRVVWGRGAFCGPKSEHCAREWLSALGGWAAVAAAVPTVLYLSKQVRDARVHQRQNLEIQLRRHRAIASRAGRAAKYNAAAALRIRSAWKSDDPLAFPLRDIDRHYRQHHNELLKAVSDQVFELVEDEIATVSNQTIRRIREKFELNKPDERTRLRPSGAGTYPHMRTIIRSEAETVWKWMKSCENECSAFLASTQKLIEPDSNTHD